MFAARFFRTSPAEAAGKALFAACVAQARRPEFYGPDGAPDTTAGRFELYTLHVILVVLRLKGRGQGAHEVSQHLFDAYVENMDIALREMGVGDPSMGKKMRKVGEMFYGRARSWAEALGDPAAVEALSARTIHAASKAGASRALADYATEAWSRLAEQADEALLAGVVRWPEPTR